MKLASLERGMGVPILEGQYEGEYDWLTHTFRYGGANLMMREVRECFKVDVARYIRVNFATFVQGIESVGGVDISLTEAEAAYINKFNKGGITCVAGQNHLDGRAALEYARCRKIDSDWQRVKRQRKQDGMWRAVINFQKKRTGLGRFQRIDDAIKARKDAEDRLFNRFLKELNEQTH